MAANDAPRRSRLRRFISWALQGYRTRISVQLVAANVLVVLLTVVLIELAVLAIVLSLPDFDDEVAINESLGEQAQVAAGELSVLPAATRLSEESLSATHKQALDRALEQLVQSGVPREPGEPAVSLGDSPRAAIISARGDVVASTSPDWAAPSALYTSIDVTPARIAAGGALGLRGGDTSLNNSYVLDYESETLAGAHPIMVDGQFAGVILFQADGVVEARQASELRGLLELALGNVVLFVLITVPALVVAIPVGIFRARRISGRLERLSDATSAMARGDLAQRVDIPGEDEVARVAQRFNEMVARLDEADRSRKAFVSNISHELRTPVAILQGNLERMIANDRTEPAAATTLEAMHQETVTLARLIDDLFTLARIEEAVIAVEPSPVDLAGCIRRAVDGIATVAWEQGRVSVESLVEDGLPLVLGEQTRIQQVLNNLLYNALRHTPEGGVIVVDAEPDGPDVAVTVADTGLGIPQDDLPYVFDRYRQVERAGRHHDGSGLGLAIVKHLVEAMDGQISVESELNQGTTFRFTLPVARHA